MPKKVKNKQNLKKSCKKARNLAFFFVILFAFCIYLLYNNLIIKGGKYEKEFCTRQCLTCYGFNLAWVWTCRFDQCGRNYIFANGGVQQLSPHRSWIWHRILGYRRTCSRS